MLRSRKDRNPDNYFISHRPTQTDTDYYLCRPGRDNAASPPEASRPAAD
ncbi:MAG: hypothetical protein U9R43_08670 [Thermodesulfobacteriota bacterium]|nr:hypothetical protein [Thermodesulfobacteriota bacterium]